MIPVWRNGPGVAASTTNAKEKGSVIPDKVTGLCVGLAVFLNSSIGGMQTKDYKENLYLDYISSYNFTGKRCI